MSDIKNTAGEFYTTLCRRSETELIEKKSLFIGRAAPVKGEQEALSFIDEIKKKHYDASHNVYAYLLGDGTARYSDDGEPQGTAGIPVLEIIKKGGFCDAVIVVTRYFGGTLLGAGGLIRAYTASAKSAAESAGIITYQSFIEFSLKCSYSDYQKLLPKFEAADVRTDGSEFTDVVTLNLAIKKDNFLKFEEIIKESGAGRILVEIMGERFDY